MAHLIEDHLYRISLDSERNHVYISAKDPEELIRFLVDNFVGSRDIYAANEILRDGSLSSVPVITNPLFKRLSNKKLFLDSDAPSSLVSRKPSLEDQLKDAEKRQNSRSIEPQLNGLIR